MTKTIKCAECNVEFTFEENPKFPRKYCLNCSAKKKQDFADNIEREPVKVGNVQEPALTQKKDDYEEDEYQIKSKQVRSNALTCAIETVKVNRVETLTNPDSMKGILKIAKEFEKYIRFGE